MNFDPRPGWAMSEEARDAQFVKLHMEVARLRASHARLLAAAKDFVLAGDELGAHGKSVHLQSHYDAFKSAISAAEELAL